MRVLLIQPPFCPPTMPPYALAYLKAFLSNNTAHEISCLDLNALYHTQAHASYYARLFSEDYFPLLTTFADVIHEDMLATNRLLREEKVPEHYQTLLKAILAAKPDVVACSIVYSSQCFFADALLQELEERGITVVIGGPAANEQLRKRFTYLSQEVALAEHLGGRVHNYHTVPDFSDFPQEQYFSRERIIPLRTVISCYYKQCTFCIHHGNAPYMEFDLATIQEAVEKNNATHVMIIDDLIHRKRLLDLSKILEGRKWWCQLRPTKDLIPHLPALKAGGLMSVAWGVESGSQTILDAMKKGTIVADAAEVLVASHAAGIINMTYILFGFPGETEQEFMETISFLKANSPCIDLVSTSIFGLQKDAPVYKNPEHYGVKIILGEERRVLEQRISYELSTGMSHEEARRMRGKYMKTIKNIDKIPRVIANFKEQALTL